MTTSKTPPPLICIQVPNREYLVRRKDYSQALVRDTSGDTSARWKVLPNPSIVIAGAEQHYQENFQEVAPREKYIQIWNRIFM